MKQDELEKNIKAHFENSEMAPSSKSWEKLRARLDTQQEKRKLPKKIFAIAASFVLGVLLVTAFYYNDDAAKQTYYVLENPPSDNALESKEASFSTETKMSSTEIEQKKAPYKNTNNQIVSTEISFKAGVEENKMLAISQQDSILEEEVQRIIAQIDQKFDKDSLTNQEVEILLTQAADKISMQKALNSSTAYSALQLLQEVEGELEDSFRESIFENLKNRYLKAKEAIATRND